MQRAVLMLFIFLSTHACIRVPQTKVLSGPSMGTTYTVRWSASASSPSEYELRRDIEAELARVDEQMSRYRSDSEIARFNALQTTEPMTVSPAFAALLAEALMLNERSRGAFDVTIAPLVDAWGFGPNAAATQVPSAATIQALLQRRGPHLLEVLAADRVRKLREDVQIDLNAIAPGHAVDRIAALLERHAIHDYLVDIGGEIRVAGHAGGDRAWRVAIDDPRRTEQVPYAGIELTNAAIATSGGYRHFRVIDGKRYAHVLDARTGYPVHSSTLAVVVVASTASQADGWATALFVLGETEGFALADEQGLAALFLSQQGDVLRERATPAFARYRLQPGS